MDRLHTETHGAAGGRRLVLLHGFTQTSVSWAPVVDALAGDPEVVTVDLPGHGRSGAVHLDLAATAAAVAEVGGSATYVGYSMGGRVALRLALDRPDLVRRLVLIGATAGIDDAAGRAARRAADAERAQAIERQGAAAFLEGWLTQPLFAGLHPRPEDLAARRANTAEGLASSLRLSGTGAMDPSWWTELPHLGRRGTSVAVGAGEREQKFTALGRRLVDDIGPTASLELVPGTGHACHLEDPTAVAALLRRR
ncbi:2-succinyl-6-hydroxy-2,4-cyclohexadiene-1-carboxylate synthase [soil metagenome]